MTGLSLASAQTDSESLFNAGTAAYSQGKLDEAAKQFREFIQLRPNDARAHLNLSTIYSKQKKWGPAWAHFRKARALDPQLPGLSILEVKLDENPPSSVGLTGPFHRWVRPFISSIDRSLLLGVLLVSVTGFLHFLIRYLKRRRWAMETEETPPQIPWTTWTTLGFSALAALALIIQIYLSGQMFGSVSAEGGASLKSAPQAEGLEVGTVPSGVELKVLRQQNDWTQVTNEAGIGGWVENRVLLTYSGAP